MFVCLTFTWEIKGSLSKTYCLLELGMITDNNVYTENQQILITGQTWVGFKDINAMMCQSETEFYELKLVVDLFCAIFCYLLVFICLFFSFLSNKSHIL